MSLLAISLTTGVAVTAGLLSITQKSAVLAAMAGAAAGGAAVSFLLYLK